MICASPSHSDGYRKRLAGSSGKASEEQLSPRFSNTAYLSERHLTSRNRAIAYMLKEMGGFPPDTDVNNVLDLYFMKYVACCPGVTRCGHGLTLSSLMTMSGVQLCC